MRTKDDIIESMTEECPWNIPRAATAYIKDAMDLWALEIEEEQKQAAKKLETKAPDLCQDITDRALILKLTKLEKENEFLQFMVNNGLGEEDLRNDITLPHEA